MLLQTLRSIATIAERAHLLIHWVCSTILRLAYLYYCSSLLSMIMRYFKWLCSFYEWLILQHAPIMLYKRARRAE